MYVMTLSIYLYIKASHHLFVTVPPEVLKLKESRGDVAAMDCEHFLV